jgi:hypothetical protein
MVLSETNRCVMEWSQKRTLQCLQRERLKKFRHFRLSICIDGCFGPREEQKSALSKFLAKITTQLIKGHKVGNKDYSSSIDLHFTSKEYATCYYIDKKLR